MEINKSALLAILLNISQYLYLLNESRVFFLRLIKMTFLDSSDATYAGTTSISVYEKEPVYRSSVVVGLFGGFAGSVGRTAATLHTRISLTRTLVPSLSAFPAQFLFFFNWATLQNIQRAYSSPSVSLSSSFLAVSLVMASVLSLAVYHHLTVAVTILNLCNQRQFGNTTSTAPFTLKDIYCGRVWSKGKFVILSPLQRFKLFNKGFAVAVAPTAYFRTVLVGGYEWGKKTPEHVLYNGSLAMGAGFVASFGRLPLDQLRLMRLHYLLSRELVQTSTHTDSAIPSIPQMIVQLRKRPIISKISLFHHSASAAVTIQLFDWLRS